VVCNHVYEHVPDAKRLLDEIYRVLKPGGVCYFAAGNRLNLIEPHHRLPLLSVMPKPLAHLYLRLLRNGNRYHETHLTLWGLRRLVSSFAVVDYSIPIIKHPERFAASEMVRPGTLRQKIAASVLSTAYWLCPTYIWVLRKAA
jgi:SAM-dependent methyltransferase